MGIVEDRSVEEERDLARMQIGAMMDTAGVGIATFEESSGWVRQQPPAAARRRRCCRTSTARSSRRNRSPNTSGCRSRSSARSAPRCATASIHPELGQRWLLTRVEPATLASGKKTASVVTLDITDQHLSQRRSEQLLREMTTILESTTAGIAYLRGGALVRCNRRFETMLRLPPSAVAGSSLAELLAGHPQAESDGRRDPRGADRRRHLRDRVRVHRLRRGRLDDGDRRRRRRRAAPGLALVFALGAPRRRRDRLRRGDRRPLRRDAPEAAAGAARDARPRARADGRAHALDPRLGAGRHRHRRQPRHRVDEPLGAAHVRRRAGRLHRRADGDRRDARRRPSVSPHPLPRRPGRRPGRDLRVPGPRPRRARVLDRRQRRRDRPRATGRQLTFALLDIERRRQAEAAVSAAQASLRRVIEAAPLAIALLDARSFAIVQANAVAAATIRRTPEDLLGKTLEEIFPTEVAAARRRDMESALATSEVTTREYRFAADGVEHVWDARLLPLVAAAARRPTSCCSSPPTSPSSAPRRRRASRRRSRSARCWSRKCTTASRTTCRASPACCSRSPAGSPRSRRRSTRSSARCRRSPRSTACRSAPTGRSRSSACSRRSPARCSAPSAGRSAAASPARAPPSGRCPRSRRSRSR